MNIRKIIIADDESIQRNVLSSVVRKIVPPLTEIEICVNGKEAFEKISKGGTDLLITDIRMPVMDGMELISLVARDFPQIKIILISAYQEFEYAKSAISCGVSEYLVKPFRIEEVRRLLQKMDEEIGEQRQTTETQNQYENLLHQFEKDNQQKALAALLNGQKPPEELQAFNTNALNHPGITILIRWNIRVHSEIISGTFPQAAAKSPRLYFQAFPIISRNG